MGRELTKLHEETFRGTINQAIEHMEKPGGETRGEFTLVLQEVAVATGEGDDAGDEAAAEMMGLLIREGVKASIAGRAVAAALGLPKNKAKKLALEVSSEGWGGRKKRQVEEVEDQEGGGVGGSAQEGFKVVGLDHIVIRARDPAALEEFYIRVLG